MTTPINAMIDAVMRCCKCGASKCDCYKMCSCGWYAEKGKPCGNPESDYCSSKLWHSPPHIEVHKGERIRLTYTMCCHTAFAPTDGRCDVGGYYGTIAATPRKGSEDVSVRWDGRTSCDRIRISWLEKVAAASTQKETR
jgi:hypothetical protein